MLFTGVFSVAKAKKSDPTKDPEFERVLGNLLKAPPKPHADMKVGKSKRKKKAPKRREK